MSQSSGTSTAPPNNVDSDDERGSNATDDQEFYNDSEDADPDYDANPLNRAPIFFSVGCWAVNRHQYIFFPSLQSQ